MEETTTKHKSSEKIRQKSAVFVPKAGKSVSNQLSGFNNFIREYGVVALAVGFVFGAQTKSVVDQFNASFVNPLLGLVLPGKGSLTQKQFVTHVLHKTTVFAWGALVETLISFLIIALIIYYTIKLLKLDRLTKQ